METESTTLFCCQGMLQFHWCVLSLIFPTVLFKLPQLPRITSLRSEAKSFEVNGHLQHRLSNWRWWRPSLHWVRNDQLGSSSAVVMQLLAEAHGSASAPCSSSLESAQTAFAMFLNEGADPAYSILLTGFSVSFWTVVPRRVSLEGFNNWPRGTQFFMAAQGGGYRADNYTIFLLKAMYRNHFDCCCGSQLWCSGATRSCLEWGMRKTEERKHQPVLVSVTACLVL